MAPKRTGLEVKRALQEQSKLMREAAEYRRRRIVAKVREGLPARIISEMYGIEAKRVLNLARSLGVRLADPREWYGLDPA